MLFLKNTITPAQSLQYRTLLSGIFIVIYLCIGAIDRYWSGVAFMKSSWIPPLTLFFIAAFLQFLISCVRLVISVLKRQTPSIWLLVLTFPLSFLLIQSIPKLGFVSGMEYRIQRDFKNEELLTFAEQARIALNDSTTLRVSITDEKIKRLIDAFPKIMNLSKAKPRVIINTTHVDIFYGSSLVKHWGLRIVDKKNSSPPFTPEESASFSEALPHIWVYHLPY